MSLDLYQALLSACIGAVAAFLCLVFIGGRLSPGARLALIGIAAIAAIVIEKTVLQMNDAYDARRTLSAALGGGIGGLIGACVGALFDRARDGKGLSLVLPLAALGFIGSEVAGFGGTQAGKSLADTLLPGLERPTIADMPYAKFRQELLNSDDFRSSGMAQAFEENPDEMDAFFRWFQKEMAKAEAEGLSQSQMQERAFASGAQMTDDLLLRADDPAVADVLALRLGAARALAKINPAYCMGSINGAALNDPQVQRLTGPLFPVVLAKLLPFDGQPRKEQMPQSQFSQLSETMLSDVYDEVGDAVLVFIGQVPVTAQNQSQYCAAETAFMAKVNDLPSGPGGLREDYYRTLTATVMASQ